MKKLNALKIWLITAFWKQNSHHYHGVIMHTLHVIVVVLKNKEWKMLPAAILHDIGKPKSAFQKPEDVVNNEYSFTDHEELSYQMIKNWPISSYTKNLVRYHYLFRRMSKAKEKGLSEYDSLKKTWDGLAPDFQRDVKIFQSYDDKGKKSLYKNWKKY